MSNSTGPSAGPEMDAITSDLRAIAQRLDDLAWRVPLRDLGRLLSRIAREMATDASRLDMLGAIAASAEKMDPDKRAELERGLAEMNAEHPQEHR